jgi:OmpA-OmpF porin, OOP family
MPPIGKSWRGRGVLALALIGLAGSPEMACAQAPAAADNPVAKLSGLETSPDIEVPALKQQVAERVKSKADNIALKRPPVATQLLKLPKLVVEIQFDEDTAIIRPNSYGTIGKIADALYDPTLLGYKFLVIGHSVSTGRREINLTLSQRRADSIRDVLVNTFKISGKRVASIGLGEEQLLDSNRPTSPVNAQVEIATIGKAP